MYLESSVLFVYFPCLNVALYCENLCLNLFLWRHIEISSDRLFNKDGFLALTKQSFSVRHKWRRCLFCCRPGQLLLCGVSYRFLAFCEH